MDKSVLGAGSKGLIQSICNDFGNMASSDFIDNIQSVVTEYMKLTSYSVGISDLIADVRDWVINNPNSHLNDLVCLQ